MLAFTEIVIHMHHRRVYSCIHYRILAFPVFFYLYVLHIHKYILIDISLEIRFCAYIMKNVLGALFNTTYVYIHCSSICTPKYSYIYIVCIHFVYQLVAINYRKVRPYFLVVRPTMRTHHCVYARKQKYIYTCICM